MFEIGDKIFYPMRGAGIVKGIEEREYAGILQEHYLIEIECENMAIIVPVTSCEQVGIRPIVSADIVEQVLEILKGGDEESLKGNWHRRYRENMEKLMTGDIMKAAEIVRKLARADRIKKLSEGEAKMLNSAMMILQSEIALASDVSMDEALAKILSAI